MSTSTGQFLLLTIASCSLFGRATTVSVWDGVSNEIEPYPPEKRSFMTCKRFAVCGLVQANAWGIHTQKFCDCPPRETCSLVWDTEDGRSVTHGSNQYKYCRRAPVLSQCVPGQKAMTDELISYPDGNMAHREYLHCHCPASHQLEQVDSSCEQNTDGDAFITVKACTKMPLCGAGQHCKFVTEGGDTTLVQVNCLCPVPQACPSITERDVEIQPFGRGNIFSIFCR